MTAIRLAEIEIELGNLKNEVRALGTALQAIEKISADARLKFDAVTARLLELAADVHESRESLQ